MKIALSAQTSSQAGSFLSSAISRRIGEMRERKMQKQQARNLRSLDDRTLRDMGLNRSEIISIVYADQEGRRIHYVRD